jgi:hypothetical protein
VKREDLPQDALEQLAVIEDLGTQAHRVVAEAQTQLAGIHRAAEREHQKLAQAREVLDALVAKRVAGGEFIADAWADYEAAITRAQSEQLRIKSRRAPKSAAAVRERGKEMRRLRRDAKLNQWIIRLYEHHFPWLSELRDPDEEAAYLAGPTEEVAQEDGQDPVRHWLSEAEYAALSPAERNQRSLDRYLRSRMSPWELGRDYERYIGYLREQSGGKVTYQGIFEGLDDLGRDLIVEQPGGTLEVVQCKRWARRKTIHEKHVFQLFGTVVAARIEHPGRTVTGTFTTTTKLSDRAQRFAAELDIAVEEQVPLADYPRIKCNIARAGGERIYHLPFDQQYDRTVIEPDRGELHASTVAEAEQAGFRRAWRWRGEADAAS